MDFAEREGLRASGSLAGGRGGIRGPQDRALAANPDVWNKTVLILNYDENDGLFDHVAPPTPPPHTHGEFVQGLPIGAGFRVPCVIVSPWTAGGWVANEWFDHTSVLRFLERVTALREPNITGWRRKTFGDMTSVLCFKEKAGRVSETAECPPFAGQGAACSNNCRKRSRNSRARCRCRKRNGLKGGGLGPRRTVC